MGERDNLIESLLDYLNQYNIHLTPESSEKSTQDFVTDCISACLENIRKEQKSRLDLQDSYKSLESDYNKLLQDLEEKNSKIHSLDSDLARLENQISLNNKSFKQEREKLTQERDSFKKEAAKLSSLCVQYSHDIKKRETELLKLQDQLRKTMGEKDLQYKNSIEIMNTFHKNGISIPQSVDYEFVNFLKQGHISSGKWAKEVFELLSETISNIFSQIKAALERLGYEVDWKDLSIENLEAYKNEIEFRIKHFSSCLNNLQRVQEDQDFSKESVPVLKQVLDGYKEMFESNILALLKS